MNSIEIKGYKSIRELNLPLRPINILIGANGSGKSNFLSFFDFLKQIYNTNLSEYVALKGGTEKFLHKGDKVTTQIEAKLNFPKNAYSFTLKKGEDQFIITKEGLWYDNNPYCENPIDISSFGNESKLRFETVKRANYIRDYMEQLEKYHFHDTGETTPFNKESNIENDKFRLYDKGQNIAAFLYGIKDDHPITYKLIVKTIQQIAPYFLDFVFMPTRANTLVLRWKSKHSSTIYGVNDLSDGTLRFIALAVLFLQPNLPATIILDEPELGLHPAAIARLGGMIQSAAAKGCQVIIATQSADLISYFEPEDIITVDQIDGESKFNRLNSGTLKNWLEDYSIDDLWKRNIIEQGQPQ